MSHGRELLRRRKIGVRFHASWPAWSNLDGFGSIAEGHPGFGNYPYTRPAAVHFDHAKHISRYFDEVEDALAPSFCSDCHALGPDGASMRTAGFDESCGSCHAAEIGGHGQVDATGIAFLGLPAVDTLSLERADVHIGRWPADTDVADGVLTPFAALLLASQPRAAADLAAVAALDWMDLGGASPAQNAAVGRLIWDLKKLLAEVAGEGHGVPS